MKWFRLYSEVRTDPKVQKLHPQLFKFWINLLCLACDLDSDGVLPPIEDLAFMMGVRQDVLVRFTSTLASRQLLERLTSGKLVIHGWATRQKASDRGSDRVKRYREKTSRNKPPPDVTLHVQNGNGVLTVLEGELEGEEEFPPHCAHTHAILNSASENPSQPPSTPRRTPEDQAEFDAALEFLGSDLRTEWLAVEIDRRATLPEMLEIPGWKFCRGSERILSPERTDGQRRSLPYFMGIVRGLRDEERGQPVHSQPTSSANGSAKPKMTPEEWGAEMNRRMGRNV
jgi:hypothetical protein